MLDIERVLRARKIQRRLSLGESDDDYCIARAEGGIFCTISAVRDDAFDLPVDQVTMGGFGYCVILDDQSVKCSPATSDSEESKAFAAGVMSAGHLCKQGDGLGVIAVAGGYTFWNGLSELSGEATAGSIWGGSDIEMCFLAPDGFVSCFWGNPLVETAIDKSSFDFANTKYIAFSQSLQLFAGIDERGGLRVKNRLDAPKTYPGPYVQVAAHTNYWCMLTNEGEIECDSYSFSRAPRDIENIPSGEFLAVDVNEKFACAVRTTGELVCWGGDSQAVDGTVRLD